MASQSPSQDLVLFKILDRVRKAYSRKTMGIHFIPCP